MQDTSKTSDSSKGQPKINLVTILEVRKSKLHSVRNMNHCYKFGVYNFVVSCGLFKEICSGCSVAKMLLEIQWLEFLLKEKLRCCINYISLFGAPRPGYFCACGAEENVRMKVQHPGSYCGLPLRMKSVVNGPLAWLLFRRRQVGKVDFSTIQKVKSVFLSLGAFLHWDYRQRRDRRQLGCICPWDELNLDLLA